MSVKTENITIEDLLNKVSTYDDNTEDQTLIRNAYDYAYRKHFSQKRITGDDYITHPLNVAWILTDVKADGITIAAALLHDTIEDSDSTYEEIENLFGEDVAKIVDGVTKINRLNFSTDSEQIAANQRKILVGLSSDVRVLIVKLADRLHNMRTLQYKSEFKQRENSLETMEIFVPLAYSIGAYRIKSELEDLSLRYLKPDMYKSIEEKKLKIEEDSNACLQEMLYKIEEILKNKNIPYEIKVRTKNIYGIYKRLNDGHKLSDIHDLLALKVMVDEIDNCYRTLGFIHAKYHPINDKFKDYICNPKTNMYQSLHTTVFGPDDRLVQTQIRTFDMDKIASFGLTAYWDINKGKARYVMQEDLKNKYQFFKSLTEINSTFGDNKEFVSQVKSELFCDRVYVYTTKGDIIELPKGSTIIDLAYKLDLGNTLVGAYVNDEIRQVDYVLKNKDRVRIVTNNLSYGPKADWINIAQTSLAKKKIKEFNNNIK